MSEIAADPSPCLRIAGLSKAFGGTQALDDVSFDVQPGSIHALLGGNGSGKSTLIKILAGVVKADSGSIAVSGASIDATDLSPRKAAESDISFVHQQDSTFSTLSVAENLAIGRGFETSRFGRINYRSLRGRASEVLARFGVDCDPEQPMASLSPAARMVVAIARALQDQERASSGILVLDEPTAALPKTEVTLLLDSLQRFAAAGQSILFVTHRLDEVSSVADRVTVLRDGRVAATLDAFDRNTLATLIAGREMRSTMTRRPTSVASVPKLEVRDLVVGPIKGVSFTANQGEVLGIAGTLGSGRSTLLKALFGLRRVESGAIDLGGESLRLRNSGDAVKAGIAFIPEDRRSEAAFDSLSVSENLFAGNLKGFWQGGRFDAGNERRMARGLMGSYLVKASSEEAVFGTLSGGNQQKVILARWLRRGPGVLLLDEPTQGVDIGARHEIWGLVRDSLETTTVVVVSSDFDELATACDRVIVLRDGKVIATCQGDELTEARLNELAHSGVMEVDNPVAS